MRGSWSIRRRVPRKAPRHRARKARQAVTLARPAKTESRAPANLEAKTDRVPAPPLVGPLHANMSFDPRMSLRRTVGTWPELEMAVEDALHFVHHFRSDWMECT